LRTDRHDRQRQERAPGRRCARPPYPSRVLRVLSSGALVMRRVILAIVSTVASLVLLLSFKTHSPSAGTPAAASSNPAGTTTSGSSSGTATTGASTSTGTKTVTGSSVDTRYGPVQVKITVT